MANINEVFGSSALTLQASDLKPGLQVPATIKSVTVKEWDDGNKLEVAFLNKEKVLVCNKTNARRIADQHGEDYEMWVGKMIHLHQDICDFQGKPTKCVRVVPHEYVVDKQQPAPAVEVGGDDVPF